MQPFGRLHTLEERDQVTVCINHAKLARAPRLLGKLRMWVQDAQRLKLCVEVVYTHNLNAAAGRARLAP
jgi:hypothetical protein